MSVSLESLTELARPDPIVAQTRRPKRWRIDLSLASWAGLGVLLFVVVAVSAGPLLWAASPIDQDPSSRLLGPSRAHPFGTDRYGRDLLARALHGGRWTLFGALVVCVSVTSVALLLGSIAAIGNRWADYTISRVAEVLFVIPQLVIALGLTSILGASLRNLIVALTLTAWPWYALAYRALVRQARAAPWIECAVACGASRSHLVLRHVLPAIIGPAVVLVTVCFGFAILNFTALSFLGLGIQPPTPEWGGMINDARPYFQLYPLQMILPGACIAITVLAVNLAGDALRDAVDPRTAD